LGEHAADVGELTLTPSGGGVFEVIVNDDLVFSKKALGRHAEDGEVLPLVSAALSG
jgi:selenoprotein W-related protein